jgi:hypothetical protein
MISVMMHGPDSEVAISVVPRLPVATIVPGKTIVELRVIDPPFELKLSIIFSVLNALNFTGVSEEYNITPVELIA